MPNANRTETNILARNPALQEIVASISAGERFFIAGKATNGYATWEVDKEGYSHNGRYDFPEAINAQIDMLQRAGVK